MLLDLLVFKSTVLKPRALLPVGVQLTTVLPWAPAIEEGFLFQEEEEEKEGCISLGTRIICCTCLRIKTNVIT